MVLLCEMFRWTIYLKGGPKDYYHAAVIVRHKMYSFVENLNCNKIEVHLFNTLSLRWKKLPPVTNGSPIEIPDTRFGHTAVLVEEIVLIWGGCEPYCNVTYAFDVNTHSWLKPNISGTIPEARYLQSACVLEKVMYVYGGRDTQMDGCTNDMYKLDTTIMVWSFINTRGPPPPASYGHSATIIGTKMFVFGGRGGDYYNSIRVFDTKTNCWLNKPSGHLLPERRRDHSAFAYNGELYVFGGRYVNQYFNDLWKYSPETFSWKQVETKGKVPCRRYGMSCCMVGDCIIIHGGCKENNHISGDLYILDLNPSLKMLCKLAVTQHGLEQSELPHDIRWELAMITPPPLAWLNKPVSHHTPI